MNLLDFQASRFAQIPESAQDPQEVVHHLTQCGLIQLSPPAFGRTSGGLFKCYRILAIDPVNLGMEIEVHGTGSNKRRAKLQCAAGAILWLAHISGFMSLGSPICGSVALIGTENVTTLGVRASYSPSYNFFDLVPNPTAPTYQSRETAIEVGIEEPKWTKVIEAAVVISTKLDAGLQEPYRHARVFDRLLTRTNDDRCETPPLLFVDVEANEVKNSQGGRDILDIGVVSVIPGQDIRYRSIVVEEHIHVRNETAVNNPEGFAHGTPDIMSHAAMVMEMIKELGMIAGGRSGVLVLHTMVNDIKWLESAGVTMTGVEICDIAQVQRAWDQAVSNKSLANLAAEYGVEVDAMVHNGGNDAYTTMRVFDAMVKRRQGEMT